MALEGDMPPTPRRGDLCLSGQRSSSTCFMWPPHGSSVWVDGQSPMSFTGQCSERSILRELSLWGKKQDTGCFQLLIPQYSSLCFPHPVLVLPLLPSTSAAFLPQANIRQQLLLQETSTCVQLLNATLIDRGIANNAKSHEENDRFYNRKCRLNLAPASHVCRS